MLRKNQWSLEEAFPNLYGWLVWGGGLNFIFKCFLVLLVIVFIASIFGAGFWIGRATI